MEESGAKPPAIDYRLLTNLLDAANSKDLYQVIVSAPFKNNVDMVFLFLGFICLYIVDEETNKIQLVAASGTEEYRLSVENMDFKLEDYTLYFDKNKANPIVKSIARGKPQSTTDWATLNRGKTSVEEVRLNQANSGIAYTAIYPFAGSVKGALMYNYYQYADGIGSQQEDFMERYTELVSRSLDKLFS